MKKTDKIFLSPEEALTAIEADFSQYGVQSRLFMDLGHIILGAETGRGTVTPGDGGIWLREKGKKHLRLVPFEQLALRFIAELKKKMADLEFLAKVLARVFRARAYPGENAATKETGIWLETGMEDFCCRQCGRCCQFLDYRREFSEEDYQRLVALDRIDILRWVSVRKLKDGSIQYRIWINPETGRFADTCPWLYKPPNQNRYYCLIQEIKPEICRQYPSSRKHAEKTGCPGFS